MTVERLLSAFGFPNKVPGCPHRLSHTPPTASCRLLLGGISNGVPPGRWVQLAAVLRTAIQRQPRRRCGQSKKEEAEEEVVAEDYEAEGSGAVAAALLQGSSGLALLGCMARGIGGEELAAFGDQLRSTFGASSLTDSDPREQQLVQQLMHTVGQQRQLVAAGGGSGGLGGGSGTPTVHIFGRASSTDGPGGLGRTIGEQGGAVACAYEACRRCHTFLSERPHVWQPQLFAPQHLRCRDPLTPLHPAHTHTGLQVTKLGAVLLPSLRLTPEQAVRVLSWLETGSTHAHPPPDRSLLCQLLATAQRGDALLVASPCRLARHPLELGAILRVCGQLGIAVFAAAVGNVPAPLLAPLEDGGLLSGQPHAAERQQLVAATVAGALAASKRAWQLSQQHGVYASQHAFQQRVQIGGLTPQHPVRAILRHVLKDCGVLALCVRTSDVERSGGALATAGAAGDSVLALGSLSRQQGLLATALRCVELGVGWGGGGLRMHSELHSTMPSLHAPPSAINMLPSLPGFPCACTPSNFPLAAAQWPHRSSTPGTASASAELQLMRRQCCSCCAASSCAMVQWPSPQLTAWPARRQGCRRCYRRQKPTALPWWCCCRAAG